MKTDHGFRMNLHELGKRIYHLRLLKDFTIKEIAFSINLSTVAYRNIEKGKSDLSVTKLLHLSKILKVDISELVKDLDRNFFHEGISIKSIDAS